jgi:hypothetical protein
MSLELSLISLGISIVAFIIATWNLIRSKRRLREIEELYHERERLYRLTGEDKSQFEI